MIRHPSYLLGSFIEVLGLKNVTVAGASIGGYFSARYAFHNPDRVSKLIFMGSPAGLESGSRISRKLLSIKNLNTFIRNSLVKPTPEGSRRMFKNFLVHNGEGLPEELYDCYYLGGLIPGAENSYRSLLINLVSLNGNGFLKKKYRINDELTTFKNPVLFIWGSGDLLASPEFGKSTVEKMKNARIDIIEDAGHAPWLDKPEECAARIIEF
jgi:pimeloyl-ACP methyl ester carboxylesterase